MLDDKRRREDPLIFRSRRTIPPACVLRKGAGHRVMSRGLCKSATGAPVPLQVKPVEDREDNPLHALDVHKAYHRSRPAPHLHKTALDEIGGPEPPRDP